MHLIFCACPPQRRLTKVTLHAQQMEKGTLKYKQSKLLGEGGAKLRTGESASCKSLCPTNIEFSGRLWKDSESCFFLQVKAVKDVSLCEIETGNQ